MKLVVTIPAYNEEETISEVIREIPKKIAGISEIEVLVINDGSSDKTAQIAKKEGATVITNQQNMGLAYSFSAGLKKALELGADIIVNTDGDFQYNQKQIPLLVKPILENKCEITLGSRFLGNIEYMPPHKKIGNILVSLLVSVLVGQKITDSQTGFRAFSKEAAMRINVFSNYTYTQETILEAYDKRLTVHEVAVDFRKREGKSRLISNIFDYARKVGLTIIQTYLNYRPLKVFFSIASVLLLVGLFFGLRVIVHYLSTGMVSPYIPSAMLSVLLFIVGFQIGLIGLIAEMVKRQRKIQEQVLYIEKKRLYSK